MVSLKQILLGGREATTVSVVVVYDITGRIYHGVDSGEEIQTA